MSAFNARLRPKVWFGLPAYTVGGLFFALPSFVLASMIELFFLQLLLWFIGGIGLLVALFFLVMGADAPFIGTMIASMRERHNTTSETWTKQ